MGRYELVNPMSLFHELDRSFGKFLSEGNTSTFKSDLSPITNVREEKDYFEISLDIPGISKEDIKVELKENILSITGERKSKYKDDQGEFISQGRFERSFSLPKSVDVENIEVSHSNGVLDVLLPKQIKPETSKVLEIKTFDQQKLQN